MIAMKYLNSLFLLVLSSYMTIGCIKEKKETEIKFGEQNYIFYFHNKFAEENSLETKHPEYGKVEYREIIESFQKEGFIVLSKKRKANTDVQEYAQKIVPQIDSLLNIGVKPNHITVIGTSKGGYIAQYVSTFIANPDINFVFVGCYDKNDVKNYPEINFCGNILTIYEKSDAFGVSAMERKKTSKLKINQFKEIELNTGLKHGFLFKQLKEWIEPCKMWAKRNYALKSSLR